jgi:hypothetical protein
VRPSNTIVCRAARARELEPVLDLLLFGAVEHRRHEAHAAAQLLGRARPLVVVQASMNCHELLVVRQLVDVEDLRLELLRLARLSSASFSLRPSP